MIYGKGGIYGTKSKRRIIPLTDRIRPLIDGHFAIHDTIGMTPRTIQRILKRLANKARINRPVCPHVLRAHLCCCRCAERHLSPVDGNQLCDLGHATQAILFYRV